MALTVELSDYFKSIFTNFPHSDKEKIAGFIKHCQTHGFDGLPGKLKRSTDVPGQDPEYHVKVQFARENYLWHYHIGIPTYERLNPLSNVLTSRYVLHFQRFPGDKVIRILDLDDHDPMTLPKLRHMVKT
ncbi:hypothetical protein D9M69_527660 [compost metagenome]